MKEIGSPLPKVNTSVVQYFKCESDFSNTSGVDNRHYQYPMGQYPQTTSTTAHIASLSTVPEESHLGVPYQREEYRESNCRIPGRDRSYDSRDCYGNHERKRFPYRDENIAR